MKVPEPRKLPSGTWFIQLRLGGVSVPVSASSKRECIQKAQLIKAEHRAGIREIKSKTEKTLKDLMQDYIDALSSSTSPSTIRGYKSIMQTRFSSVIDTPISKIRDWQKVIDEEAKNVKGKTLKNSWFFLCAALRKAGESVPEVKLPQVVRNDKQWLEPDEVLKFIKLLEHDRFEIPILLALHGLRRSEIFAMTYEKIDLKAKTITVHGAAVLDDDGKLVQKATNKNATSRRVVPILIPELTAAVEAVPEEKRTGLIYNANPTTLYWKINTICEANGLPKVGVHGLRHSFASLAFHLGLSEQETMELGGWADYNTMRKIYTHLAQADRLKGHNKLAAFFAGDADKKDDNANKNAN